VRSLLIHEPTGQQFDLAGFVSAAEFEWLEAQHRFVFRCGQCQGALYLRHNPGNRDKLHGVHQADEGCRDLVVRRASPMTDEHKRECEYHALASEAGGWRADCEVRTTGRTVVDVVVDGRLGFEIQHSGLSVDAVRGRTARSVASGLQDVSWFTDRRTDPLWYGLVPSYKTTMLRWDQLPRLGTVTVSGPRIIEAVTCRWDTGPCPDGKVRPCGRPHPKEQLRSMLLDEVVTMRAAGELVSARFGKYIRLTDPASVSLYEELTGKSAVCGNAVPALVALRNQESANKRIECERPVVHLWRFPGGKQLELDFSETKSPGACNVPGCYDEGRLYMVGLRCDAHKPQRRLRMVG
jgi:hypothetical protein